MKTLAKSLALLEVVAQRTAAVGVRELSRLTGYNATTVCNILKTLTAGGYLSSEDGRYSLGLKSYLLGRGHNYYAALYSFCKPFMARLAQRLATSASLLVAEGLDTYLLGSCTPTSEEPFIDGMGQKAHPYCLAAGRLFLAHMSAERQRAYFRKHPLTKVTRKTITDRAELTRELERIRAQGYATISDEREEGVSAVAVGILGGAGAAIAAVGIRVPTRDFTKQKQKEVLGHLREAAREMSECLASTSVIHGGRARGQT